MVALETPPPCRDFVGLTIDGDMVALGVAHQAERLDFAQHEFEFNDVHHFLVPGHRQRGLQQRVDGIARSAIEILQRHAIAAARRVMPIEAVGVVQRTDQLRTKRGRDRSNNLLRGFAHTGRGGERGDVVPVSAVGGCKYCASGERPG